MALPTSASADFGADKPAGVPCRHLRSDDRCEIHDRLRPAGWRGCDVFDCFGAGQRVTVMLRAEHGGRASWRDLDERARNRIFAAFGSLRRLHETSYHLGTILDSLGSVLGPTPRADLASQLARVAAEISWPLEELARHDPDTRQRAAGAVFAAVSGELRCAHRAAGEWPGRMPRGVGPGADLMGRRLGGQDLRTADLRGALLIAADLRGADLRRADLLGADLRDADLRGADLRGALFVSAPQLAAARGDGTTRLPEGQLVPRHWLE